jgi:hypothetical protein
MEDFKELPSLLYELIIKHNSINESGCIHRAYKEYYSLMKNKECILLDFYNKEDLEYLRVEPEPQEFIEFNKEYFLSNKFIFENMFEDIAYFRDKDISFYIIQDIGSAGDYDCCASIILRYKSKVL